MPYAVRPKHGRFAMAVLVFAVAAGIAGAQQTAAPPAEVRVYACDVHDATDTDSGAAPAIRLVGARNGAFSGKVVAAPGRVTGATASDLKRGSNVIPASAIRIRYGAPCGELGSEHIRPPGNDLLLESPPAHAADTLPVWITVQVPKDAAAGSYVGQLMLKLPGGTTANVPVTMDVRDWTLPDPQDYRTWVDLVQSPDTLAVEYDVPLWSDRHWELIARSLDLMAGTGSRVIYVPLIAQTHYGNAESMVRWIRKRDGTYDYDFSVLEKYLDLVAKHLGTPKVTLLYAWEVYLKPPREAWTKVATTDPHGAAGAKRVELEGKGPAVTLVDPVGGKTELFNTPRYEDPAAKALWKPVWDGVRERLTRRGWQGGMMIGMVSDERPSKEEVVALNELSGGLPWTCCAHHLNSIVPYKTLGVLDGVAPFGYAAVALDFYFNFNPAKGGQHYGWDQPLSIQYWRFQYFNAAPLNRYNTYVDIRHAAELQITGNKRGVGHIGGDFWPCLKDKRGRARATVIERFPESFWHNLMIMSWLLGPGPGGPVGTARLEVLREGVQECEARIVIESALKDERLRDRLGDELARRAQDCLDSRLVDIWKGVGVVQKDLDTFGFVTAYRTWYFEIAKRVDHAAGLKWYIANGWQHRSARLFDLAGEVTRKLGEK